LVVIPSSFPPLIFANSQQAVTVASIQNAAQVSVNFSTEKKGAAHSFPKNMKIILCFTSFHEARSLIGDSITDGWSKPDFVKEILVRPMSSSATSTNSQSVSCIGR
jgi:hypothetical protein